MDLWGLSKPGLVVFMLTLIVGSISMGYLGRRAGLGERAARRMSYFVVMVPYTLIAFLAILGLRFHRQYIALPFIGFAIMGAGLGLGLLLARLMRMPDRQAGAFVLTCGASNLGFTMGGFVNYLLFGQQGLGLAAMYTIYWNFGMVLVLYPIARHFGHGGGQPLWRLVLNSFWDIRSLPLVGVAVGLTLNLTGHHLPAFVGEYHVLRWLIIGGVFVSFATTGLTLHFGGLGRHGGLFAAIGVAKFLFLPAVGAALVWLMAAMGWPLPSPAGKVVLVQASTAVAIYAVLISNMFGLDDRLASIIFVINTTCYLLIVLPLVVWLLG
ncbi:MAG: hypothetical protein BIFFINMI_02361 [Phycisphaerae bacterium]|nr:hypothetical protein [Phycisphaerae bacterium]